MLGFNINANVLWTFSFTKQIAKAMNGAKTPNASPPIWAYKISNFELASPKFVRQHMCGPYVHIHLWFHAYVNASHEGIIK